MTTRQEAIDAARQSAAEAMRAKGEVEPMIIAHTAKPWWRTIWPA